MKLLRFLTAGSVDDGKSTLIGRLLYDTQSILDDHLEAVTGLSKNKELGEIDLALLTDGLRSEREQGITIDVAYKYFSTSSRKFIVADTPGHIEYTRNMVTGASNSDLVIILMDVRKGVIEQTRRHSILASLLKISHVVVAVNKMDLVGFAEERFVEIQQEYLKLASQLSFKKIEFIPISALHGDNVVDKSQNMPWFNGPSLLQFLEKVNIENVLNLDLLNPRFSVQYVIRPQLKEYHDYRGYAGKIMAGSYQKGDQIVVLPSLKRSRIESIEQNGVEVFKARSNEACVIKLQDNLDISRGDLLCVEGKAPVLSSKFEAYVCWMDDYPMKVGGSYFLQVNSKRVKAKIISLDYKIDVNLLQKIRKENSSYLEGNLNDILKITLQTVSLMAIDSYLSLKVNGQGILIDTNTFATVAACMFSAGEFL